MSECIHEWFGEEDPVCFKCGNYKIDIPSATGKVMCETISKHLKKEKGVDVSPKELWEYSPTGELSFVFDMYRKIKVKEIILGDNMSKRKINKQDKDKKFIGEDLVQWQIDNLL